MAQAISSETKTTYVLTVELNEQRNLDVQIGCPPELGLDNVFVHATDDNRFQVAVINYARYVQNPLNVMSGLGSIHRRFDGTSDELAIFRKTLSLNEYNGYDEGGEFNLNSLVLDLHKQSGPGQYYLHGGVMDDPGGFDTSPFAAVWVADDAVLAQLEGKTKEEQKNIKFDIARTACELYSNWLAGECYEAEVHSYDATDVDENELLDYYTSETLGPFYLYEEAVFAVKQALGIEGGE